MKTDKTRSFGFKEKFSYRFDALMAKGIKGQFLLLAVVATILLVIISAGTIFFAILLSVEGLNVVNLISKIFMLLLVPDPMFLEEEGPLIFIACVFSIFGGLFVGGSLIGVLTTAIDGKIEELRRGRSFVAETNHTVILGWSSKIFRVVEELFIANEIQPGEVVTILSAKDSTEMNEEFEHNISDFRGSKLVCRTGSATSISDLELVNISDAKSVVILSPEGKKDPDSYIIKILLSISKVLANCTSEINMVAEIKDPSNCNICKIIAKNANLNLVTLVPNIIVPRLLVQSCRKQKLSYIYMELFDFEGDEIYIKRVKDYPSLIGKSFYDALFAFDTSSLIGIIQNEEVFVNPSRETVLSEDDDFIVISENYQSVVLASKPLPEPDTSLIKRDLLKPKRRAEKNLVLGWTNYLCFVLKELQEYMEQGSKLTIISAYENTQKQVKKTCRDLSNYDLEFIEADLSDRDFLDTIKFENYDNILVMPDMTSIGVIGEIDNDEYDARTIKTLVHIKDIATIRNANFGMTSQLLAKESADVAMAAKLGDFVVSDEIVGRVIAQLAINNRLKRVFDMLLTPEGSEIYIRAAEEYLITGKEMYFGTLIAAAYQRQEIAIGYIKGDNIFINCDKSKPIFIDRDDKIIVVAEH